MTVYGYDKVECEDHDEELIWCVYAPNSPPETPPIVRIHYRYLFDTTEIKKDKNAYNALVACVCSLGLPSGGVMAEVLKRFPNLSYQWIAPDLLQAMKNSSWATPKSKILAKKIQHQLDNPNKSDANKPTNNSPPFPGAPKKKKKRPEFIDEEVIVECDDNGNEIEDSESYEEPVSFDRDEDLIFETTSEKIGQTKRKLNL